MEYWHIVTIAVLVVILLAEMFGDGGAETRAEEEAMRRIKNYHYPETSQQTQQRGTPEQERGSDDTG